MWWKEGVGSMPQTIEECDRRLRSNFEGATVLRGGEVLMKDGVVIDEAAWKERVKRVFDRQEEYQYKWVLNRTRGKLGK